MRIIGGTARSLPLKTLNGTDTRPTTDRIKETLFNILGDDVRGSVFLDLFAGCGGVGLEAVSRGASRAVFVDHSSRAASCIRENIHFTKFDRQCEVIRMDFLSALKAMEGSEKFDIVFIDPPYGRGLSIRTMEYLAGSSIVTDESLIIVEESMSFDPDDLDCGCFETVRVKKYKTNQHIFLKRRT